MGGLSSVEGRTAVSIMLAEFADKWRHTTSCYLGSHTTGTELSQQQITHSFVT
jgi:hypothetical protein